MIRNARHVNPPRFLHAKTVANPNHSTKIESFTFTCLATLYIHLYSFIKPFPFFNPIPPPKKNDVITFSFQLSLPLFFFLLPEQFIPARQRIEETIEQFVQQINDPLQQGGLKRKNPSPKQEQQNLQTQTSGRSFFVFLMPIVSFLYPSIPPPHLSLASSYHQFFFIFYYHLFLISVKSFSVGIENENAINLYLPI